MATQTRICRLDVAAYDPADYLQTVNYELRDVPHGSPLGYLDTDTWELTQAPPHFDILWKNRHRGTDRISVRTFMPEGGQALVYLDPPQEHIPPERLTNEEADEQDRGEARYLIAVLDWLNSAHAVETIPLDTPPPPAAL